MTTRSQRAAGAEMTAGDHIRIARAAERRLRRRKYACPICGNAVRLIGKHGNQKHGVELRPLADGGIR